MSQSSRLAVIGAGVGVAVAGVITFLVVKGDPQADEERRFSRTAERVEVETAPASRAEVAPVHPSPTPIAKADASTTPAAKDAAKAEADDKKKKADADAKAARQRAIEEARKNGILGKAALKQGGAFASLTGTGDISSGFDDTNIYGGLLGNEVGEMTGGFGYGKVGTKVGGTGWGTIGTGRYGTIGRGGGGGTGRGYGVGAGRGGMRGRATAVPSISIGQPTTVPTVAGTADPGTLDKAIIRRYIRRHAQKLHYCYEKELLAKPGLKGRVVTQFTITTSGNVGTVSASGVSGEVSSCMANVLRGIQFPKPRGTGGVTVTYPFTMRPGGP